MIASIGKFFSQFIAPGLGAEAGAGEQALRVATAALLLEMMRMDDHFADSERAAIAEALRHQFGLDGAQLEALIALATREAAEANSYHQFTSLINKHCDAAQKIRIVENLWLVAMADGHLAAHELHLMRKITDLLHVGHADNAAAKQRAREKAGLPATAPPADTGAAAPDTRS